ncbi:MAG: Curved DNA-binding protein [Phycisphaerae bacterium]|nr:Curved DNA-binding protein [Phycisphaerae bacterium]
MLSDKQKRAAYDQFGFAGPRGTGTGGPGGPGGFRGNWGGPGGVQFDFGDLGDLFEMFGGGPSRGRGRRSGAGWPGGFGPQPGAGPAAAVPGQDIRQEVVLSFEEAAQGTSREIRLAGPDGAQTLTVKIPAGVEDGAKIRLRGKGQPSPTGGPSGDLYIIPRISPHPWFRREGRGGLDVTLDVPVTVAEAALGAKVEVPTLRGKATVTIPPGTSGGARLRLRSQGIESARDQRRGDLFVVIRIVLPREMDDAGRKLLEEFARLNPAEPRKDLGW